MKRNQKDNGDIASSMTDSDLSDSDVTTSWTSSARASDMVDARPSNNDNSRIRQTTTPTVEDKLLPRPGVSRDSEFYSMNHAQRGVALIFNQKTFRARRNGTMLKTRTGTENDAERLQETFSTLGFKVRCYDDSTKDKITRILTEVGQKEDHTDRDCIAIAILTHGYENGRVSAIDDDFDVSVLWRTFAANVCPSLAGKPKLFFIQACRGSGLDDGVIVTDAVDSGCESPSKIFTVPSYADFLISYSTFDDQYSFRNKMRGSWYVQTLCDELRDNGRTKDLLIILTDVNRKVAQGFRSVCPKEPDFDHKVQIPYFSSSLTRRLHFGSELSK